MSSIVNWHDPTRNRSLVVGIIVLNRANVWLTRIRIRIRLMSALIHNRACLDRWLSLRLSYKLRSCWHSIRSLCCITCWALFLRQTNSWIWPHAFLLYHHILTAFKWRILHRQLSHSWSKLGCTGRWLLLWHYKCTKERSLINLNMTLSLSDWTSHFWLLWGTPRCPIEIFLRQIKCLVILLI